MRDPHSVRAYDLGIFTLDTSLTPEEAIERYSWRRPIEPSNAAGKQLTGVYDAATARPKPSSAPSRSRSSSSP
jgi:hypothetical protein